MSLKFAVLIFYVWGGATFRAFCAGEQSPVVELCPSGDQLYNLRHICVWVGATFRAFCAGEQRPLAVLCPSGDQPYSLRHGENNLKKKIVPVCLCVCKIWVNTKKTTIDTCKLKTKLGFREAIYRLGSSALLLVCAGVCLRDYG